MYMYKKASSELIYKVAVLLKQAGLKDAAKTAVKATRKAVKGSGAKNILSGAAKNLAGAVRRGAKSTSTNSIGNAVRTARNASKPRRALSSILKAIAEQQSGTSKRIPTIQEAIAMNRAEAVLNHNPFRKFLNLYLIPSGGVNEAPRGFFRKLFHKLTGPWRDKWADKQLTADRDNALYSLRSADARNVSKFYYNTDRQRWDNIQKGMNNKIDNIRRRIDGKETVPFVPSLYSAPINARQKDYVRISQSILPEYKGFSEYTGDFDSLFPRVNLDRDKAADNYILSKLGLRPLNPYK